MSRQDPWSLAEAVILLEATLKYKTNEMTRSEAVTTVSDQLRQMAQNKGQEIDEIYRNLNGISFQLSSMESALAGHTIMKPATHLFSDTVALYRSDPSEYRRILSEAKSLISSTPKTNEQLFMEWLSRQFSPEQLLDLEVMYKEIDDFCKKNSNPKQSLFDIQDYSTARAAQHKIESNRLFRFLHKRKMSKYIAAISHYCTYIKEREKAGRTSQKPEIETEPVTAEADTSEEKVVSVADEERSDASLETPKEAPAQDSEKAETDGAKDNSDESLVQEGINGQPQNNTEAATVEEQIKNILKQECEKNSFGTTLGFLQNALPSVPQTVIKFTLRSAPWAFMRYNRWHYQDDSLQETQRDNEQLSTQPGNPDGTKKPTQEDRQERSREAIEETTKQEDKTEFGGFTAWLKKRCTDKSEVQSIIADLFRIEAWAKRNGIPDVRFIGASPSECSKASTLLLGNTDFRRMNSQEGNRLIAAISQLLAYYSRSQTSRAKEAYGTSAVSDHQISTTDQASEHPESGTILAEEKAASVIGLEDYPIVAFENKESYAFSKPISASYFGEQFSESSWRRLYVRVCKLLFDDYPDVFSDLLDESQSGDRKFLVYGAETAKRLTTPAEIADGYYVETNRSASDLIQNIKKFLDLCRVDYENLVIRFVRSTEKDAQEKTPIEPMSTSETAIGASEKTKRSNGRNDFIEYLKATGYARGTANTTASSVSKVSDYCAELGVCSEPLFDIVDGKRLDDIWQKLCSLPEFRKANSSVKFRFSFAMKLYLAFRKGETPNAGPSPEKKRAVPVSASLQRTTTHPGRSEFEAWLHAATVPAGSIKTYADSVAFIGQFLLRKGLEDRDIFSIRGIARLENIRAVLSGNVDYEIERSASTISLDMYALKKYISFRKNDSSEELDNEDAERFAAVLRDNFENGFRPNSIIDRNRFKQYYADQYGSEPTQNNDEIVEILRQIGTMQEDRIFVREGSAHSDLLDDIQAEIARTFKSGASCIYLSELFVRHQEELAEQLQVFNQDVLRQLLLSTSYDEYYASKNCFCVRGVKPNADEDIRKLMRQSQTPLDYDEIHQRLWYIPLDTIKYYLATTKEMVNVTQGTYFYAPNLPVSAEELNRIAEFLHAELAQKSFVTDAEMRAMIEKNCPSVAINTESFTTWGLRDCLSVLLQNRFAFVGPIISEKGMALNMGQVFAEFSRAHDRMTFDELKEFAKSVNNGFIYWESVMEEMVRISRDEFIHKSRISFDIDVTDDVLDGLLDGDYAPIKDFGLFLHFPAVGVQWNEYVLESYVAGFSRQFSLLHSGYTATECCGGIVRKTSSIKDFQSLVTDVLAHSDNWKTRDEALALLVKQGYLQRKHYAKIDVILGQAKLMREQDRAEETAGI